MFKRCIIMVCIAVSLMISGAVNALENNMDAVKVRPELFRKNPALTPEIAKSAQASEQDTEMLERFKTFRNALDQYKASPAKRQISPERSRRTIRQSSDNSMDIKLRPNVNTPMQIKVTPSGLRKSRSRSDDETTVRNFLRFNRNVLGIHNPDAELKLDKNLEDGLGRRHLRFSQQFRNIPVWPSEMTVHLTASGEIDLLNGAFVQTPKKPVTTPALTADEAVALARKHVSGGVNASAKKSELIIYAPGDKPSRLAWKTELDLPPDAHWLTVVDAISGEILSSYNTVTSGSISGTGVDLFGNARTLNLWEDNGKYYMVNTGKAMYNTASAPPSVKSTYGAIMILDMKNSEDADPYYVTSSSPTSGWVKDAVSAAFCLSETYDYFREHHNRNAIDDRGSSIFGVIRVGENYKNAFWNSETQMMYFGDGQPYAGALDVVAHELTHGITSYTANLVYQDQPGALNEAFSDIFGEAVEARTTGAADWKMGTNLSYTIRLLSNPSSLEIISGSGRYYPSKMSQFYTRNDSLLNDLEDQDYGGVHINTTIVSHAFYLLAEGMSGHIGIQDAEKIFYRALTYHLVSNSKFIDARLACITSAEELFGKGSNQAARTAMAFDAVEIFDGASTPAYTPSTTAVQGPDAALFVYFDTKLGGYYLGRRETNDPAEGVRLSSYPVYPSRPSVSQDGSFAVFTDSANDTCFIDTDGNSDERCMGWYNTASVAMSEDSNLFGFVFLDQTGNPSNKIAIFDLTDNRPAQDSVRIFDLVAPAFDGTSTNTILQADSMTFTMDNRYIVYDAFNVITVSDGSQTGVWSIYSIDLSTNQTLVVMPPVLGYDIGYPALSQTNDSFVTFDAYNQAVGKSTIYTLNLISGDKNAVVQLNGEWGTPCYTGDDKAIVYSNANSAVSTRFSLWRQALANDRMTPSGSASLYIDNADFVSMYRRADGTIPDDEDDSDSWYPEEESSGGCFIRSLF